MNSKLSRRSFLKGAGVAALGAAAAGALSGCGNGYASAEEGKNLATQAPGVPSWLGEAPIIDEADITETVDTEVVVVGCRTGGLPAVIAAAENGAQVLGIEQLSEIARRARIWARSTPATNWRRLTSSPSSRLAKWRSWRISSATPTGS